MRRVGLLFACALLACAMLQMAQLSMHWKVPSETPARGSFAALSLPCLVLTLNVSNVDPSTRSCIPFVAPTFTEQELDFVSPSALAKIRNPMLLESASEAILTIPLGVLGSIWCLWAIRRAAKSSDAADAVALPSSSQP